MLLVCVSIRATHLHHTYTLCQVHVYHTYPILHPREKFGELVYEEWQAHGIPSKACHSTHFRCRRQRTRRQKEQLKNPTNRVKRKLSKKGYVGCGCTARHTLRILKDGTLEVVFRGTHNHGVQSAYAQNFLNPIRECTAIRETVDSKLFAGVSDARIWKVLMRTALVRRRGHKTFEDLRRYHMTLAMEGTAHIRYRRLQLGLQHAAVTLHADDSTAVQLLVKKWADDPAVITPVRYVKVRPWSCCTHGVVLTDYTFVVS